METLATPKQCSAIIMRNYQKTCKSTGVAVCVRTLYVYCLYACFGGGERCKILAMYCKSVSVEDEKNEESCIFRVDMSAFFFPSFLASLFSPLSYIKECILCFIFDTNANEKFPTVRTQV